MVERPCAVLLKSSPRAKTWEFISYTLREEVAWRSASILLESERSCSPRAKVIVVLREDYDVGRIRPLRAPKGFKTKESVLDQESAIEVEAEAEAQVEPAPLPKRETGRLLDEL
jgi:hypothetical protein